MGHSSGIEFYFSCFVSMEDNEPSRRGRRQGKCPMGWRLRFYCFFCFSCRQRVAVMGQQRPTATVFPGRRPPCRPPCRQVLDLSTKIKSSCILPVIHFFFLVQEKNIKSIFFFQLWWLNCAGAARLDSRISVRQHLNFWCGRRQSSVFRATDFD